MNLTRSPFVNRVDTRQRRRCAYGGLVGLVVAGHVGALAALLGAHPGMSASEVGLARPEAPGRMDIWLADGRPGPLPWVGSAPTEAVRPAAAVVSAAPRPPARPQTRPVLRLQSPPALKAAPQRPQPGYTPAPVAGADAPSPSATTAHFYTFGEVDIPAEPAAEWQLDAATLDVARLPRIVFDLFVSDDGSVVACSILQPADIDPEVRLSLESRLRSTALMPATRAGQPVNSVRRIELFVS